MIPSKIVAAIFHLLITSTSCDEAGSSHFIRYSPNRGLGSRYLPSFYLYFSCYLLFPTGDHRHNFWTIWSISELCLIFMTGMIWVHGEYHIFNLCSSEVAWWQSCGFCSILIYSMKQEICQNQNKILPDKIFSIFQNFLTFFKNWIQKLFLQM